MKEGINISEFTDAQGTEWQVIFKVEQQQFRIGTAWETESEAAWFGEQFRAAINKLIERGDTI